MFKHTTTLEQTNHEGIVTSSCEATIHYRVLENLPHLADDIDVYDVTERLHGWRGWYERTIDDPYTYDMFCDWAEEHADTLLIAAAAQAEEDAAERGEYLRGRQEDRRAMR